MKQLWILNSVARSGKDTFVDIVKRYMIRNKIYRPVKNISSVDRVKEAALLLGWDGIKDNTGRKFLSDLKILSTENYNGPFEYMTNRMEQAYDNSILFFHIRESTEIAYFKRCYPQTKTILIKRDVIVPNNMADQNVNDYDYDYYVDNFLTLEYYEFTVEKFIEEHIL